MTKVWNVAVAKSIGAELTHKINNERVIEGVKEEILKVNTTGEQITNSTGHVVYSRRLQKKR